MAEPGPELAYNLNLRVDVQTDVNPKPRAKVHSVEWRKVMNGAWMAERRKARRGTLRGWMGSLD